MPQRSPFPLLLASFLVMAAAAAPPEAPVAPVAPEVAAVPKAPYPPKAGTGTGTPPPVIPNSISFDPIPKGIKGGEKMGIDFGTAPSKAIVKVLLVDAATGDPIANIIGPIKYPSAKLDLSMPILLKKYTGVSLYVVTIGKDGAVLAKGQCPACRSSSFDLGVGDAATPDKLAAARAGPPSGGPNAVRPSDMLLYLKVLKGDGKKLSRAESRTVLTSLKIGDLTPSDASTFIDQYEGVYDENVGSPSVEEVATISEVIRTALAPVDNITPVLEKPQSDSIISTITKVTKSLAKAGRRKVAPQLTAQEVAANTIQKLLEQLRNTAAATDLAAGTIEQPNVCSVVTAAEAGGTFCSGGAYPIETSLSGAGLPTNTHRMTAVYLSQTDQDAQDQTLTTTLDLTAANSPHFAAVATPNTVEARAHTLTSKFDSANPNGLFPQAADAEFNCYQRIVTPNGQPSSVYTQVAAANQVRAGGTAVTCTGANSPNIRWVTLAKSLGNAPVNPTSTTSAATAAGSIRDPTTPPTPSAPTGSGSEGNDDGNTSSILGGILGGGCGLLILLGVAALVIGRRRGDQGNHEEYGVYHDPALEKHPAGSHSSGSPYPPTLTTTTPVPMF